MRRSWAAVTVGVLAAGGAGRRLRHLQLHQREHAPATATWCTAFFRDALGLFDKSGVRSAGIDIGKIERKAFDPETGLAKISIRINQGITLYENAVVSKRSASLLGEFYLDIDPGTAFETRDGAAAAEPGAEGRRPDPLRQRGDQRRRDHGPGEHHPAHPAADPARRADADLRAGQGDRRQRQRDGRQQRGGAGAAAAAGGQHRRPRRGHHPLRGRRHQGGHQQRPRDHRGAEEPGGQERGRGRAPPAASCAARSRSCRRASTAWRSR